MQCFVLLRLTDQPQLANPDLSGRRCGWGDVATYVNGYAFKPSDYSDSGLPIVRIQNLTGNAYRTNRYEGTLPEKFAIQDGDILISWSASLGVFEWNQGPAWLNQHIFRVVFNKAMIDKRFFVHQARFLIQKSQNLAHGATMKHLTKKVFETLPFLYLGLDNQITIAEQLDALDTQINRAKRQIRFLDNLAKSRFVEMFGDTYLNSMAWDSCKLGELISFMTSGSRGWARYYSDDGEYFLTIKNVKKCKVDVTGVQHVIAPVGKESVRTKVQENDVLISITADLGRTGVVTKEIAGHGAYINQHLACIRLTDDSVDPVFLSHFLESPGGIDQFAKKNQNGVKAGLNFNLIRSLEIQTPPLTLQQEFATFVSQVDKSRFIAKQQIEKLQMLYDSLAQDYFGD